MLTRDGKRIELVRTPGIDTHYIWDGENIQNETNTGGLNRDVFTYEPAGYGRLLSATVSGVEKFYLFDALGSVDRLLGQSQAVTDRYLYEAFGSEVLKTGTTRNPFRWNEPRSTLVPFLRDPVRQRTLKGAQHPLYFY